MIYVNLQLQPLSPKPSVPGLKSQASVCNPSVASFLLQSFDGNHSVLALQSEAFSRNASLPSSTAINSQPFSCNPSVGILQLQPFGHKLSIPTIQTQLFAFNPSSSVIKLQLHLSVPSVTSFPIVSLQSESFSPKPSVATCPLQNPLVAISQS